ncbi:zinc ribbon domain-containing protein [Paenibacillus sp. strain BS8-2]
MNWIDIGATTLVLLLAGALISAMFLIIRVASGDSDSSKTVRDMVETLFGTPAHLRSGTDNSDEPSAAQATNKSSSASFSEPCPACGDTVTERDVVCPSCELRLL